MCGFCGIAGRHPGFVPERERLSRMAGTLVHRGPDDEGILARGPLGVGFRRLSIIDLAGGHQPIFNEDEDVAVFVNGEVYNFRELRADLEQCGHVFRTRSDAESVLHLYEEKGEAFVDDLLGMYAVCICDFRGAGPPKIVLVRDRLGIKPMYYAWTEEALVFGSETKAILAAGARGLGRDLDARALADYLIQGYVAGEDGAWRGIKRLPPASRLVYRVGEEPRVERYWDLPLDGPREAAPADEILEWVDRVVTDRLVADVPLGAFLSGGIDSTAVVESMARASAGNGSVVACTVGFEDKAFSELERAESTARRLGAVHHTQILHADPTIAVEELPWFFDEPLADPSTVPTYLVSKMAREHVTVALAGDGGDEVFAGYRRYVFDVAENRVRALVGVGGGKVLGALGHVYPKLDWAPRFLRAKSVLENFATDPARAYWQSFTQLPREEVFAVLAPDLAAELADHDPFHAFRAHYERPRYDDPLYRAQYADFHGFLPDRILTKTDRASMANSLEVRVPMLDHRFVGRFVNLPTAEKVRAGRGKHALREALRSRVPAEILDGKKQGFDTPLRSWIAGPLAGPVAEALGSVPEEWLRREVLADRLREHRAGVRDHSALLWSVLVLEHWRRRHDVRGVVA